MSRFNLVEEAWILVLEKESGKTEMVSLKEVFQNAHRYKKLAGDSRTQDFALMRLLLSVLQTVYSRMDAEGKAYKWLELDDRYRARRKEDEKFDEDSLENTWGVLWGRGHFDQTLEKYLDAWKDRFYLFDEEHPFFQVTKDMISPDKIKKGKATPIYGKNINRLISESGNKIALFSPKYESGGNKEILREDEIARWLLAFQGYTGISDKAIFGEGSYKVSKGWLFDLGGIYLEGDNLFESLMLNLILIHPEDKLRNKEQKPCWERDCKEILEGYLDGSRVDNLAELYTNWSRAIYIDPEADVTKPFSFEIVKLPELPHVNQFLEPMTLWHYNESGENKGSYTPRKHPKNKALWRSFGMIAFSNRQSGETEKQAGILEHFQNLKDPDEGLLKDLEKSHRDKNIRIQAVSMEDDGNPTSWLPVDEICDDLKINKYIFKDDRYKSKLKRIADIVEVTQKAVSRTYGIFLHNVEEVRNVKSKHFSSRKIEEAYFLLNGPFKSWIASIQPDEAMGPKEKEWKHYVKGILLREANQLLEEANPRDYRGVPLKIKGTDEVKGIKNIATAYNSFSYFLNQDLS